MKNGIRFALASTALMAGLAVACTPAANAQVSFQGVFPLPHGQLSIVIGDPAFAVGAYVPSAYPIAFRPYYGYGFPYRDHWVPVRRFGPRWIVCDRPYAAERAYGYRGPGGHYYGHGNGQWQGRGHGHSGHVHGRGHGH